MKHSKKLLIILVLLFVINQLYGQSYKSILTGDTTYWNCCWFVADASHTEAFISHTDTFIDGKRYRKLFSSQLYPGGYTSGLSQDLGWLGEDTITGKYYQRKDGEDILIMDMSLSVGDTFELPTNYFPITEPHEVDSVFFVGTDSTKVIQFEKTIGWFEEPIQFIEGIGPTHCFASTSGNPYGLLCKFSDDVLEYEGYTQTSWGCIKPIVGFEQLSDLQIKLLPNPTTGVVSILSESQEECFYRLVTISGQMIESGKFRNNTILEIKTSGKYLLSIECGNQSGEQILLVY